jgi:hypothetical protein
MFTMLRRRIMLALTALASIAVWEQSKAWEASFPFLSSAPVLAQASAAVLAAQFAGAASGWLRSNRAGCWQKSRGEFEPMNNGVAVPPIERKIRNTLAYVLCAHNCTSRQTPLFPSKSSHRFPPVFPPPLNS